MPERREAVAGVEQSKNERLSEEIADLCGITKNLMFHRQAYFGDNGDHTNGVPIESARKMLRHKNLRTTQHYAKIKNKKVSEDMQLLKEILKLSRTSIKIA